MLLKCACGHAFYGNPDSRCGACGSDNIEQLAERSAEAVGQPDFIDKALEKSSEDQKKNPGGELCFDGPDELED